MTEQGKKMINKALGFLKMALTSNSCGIATDHEGHLFIFDNKEYTEKGKLEECSGMVVNLQDLIR